MKNQQTFKFRFSTKFSPGWQNIEKQREIVLVVCFPLSARYHIFQRSVKDWHWLYTASLLVMSSAFKVVVGRSFQRNVLIIRYDSRVLCLERITDWEQSKQNQLKIHIVWRKLRLTKGLFPKLLLVLKNKTFLLSFSFLFDTQLLHPVRL